MTGAFPRFPYLAAMEPADEEFRAGLRSYLSANPAPPMDILKLEPSLRAAMDWHRGLADAGYPVPNCPAEYGGADRPITHQLIQAEEMAAAGGVFSVNIAGVSMLTPLLLALGTPEQRARWIPPIVAGRTLWTQLFSEPGAGSDLFALRTKAIPDGDVLRVTGQKIWNSWAAEADYGLMLARTEPDSKGKAGISCFMVDMSSRGVDARPIQQMSGAREFAEVFFDEVQVPLENVIGELHRGAVAALQVLASERSGLTMGFYAMLAVEFEELLAVADPVQVQRHLDTVTDIWSGLAVARLGAIRLASSGSGTSELGVAAAGKIGVGTLATQIAHLRADLLGGRLIAHDPDDAVGADMSERFLGALALSLGGGTHQMQRNAIADGLLGLPR